MKNLRLIFLSLFFSVAVLSANAQANISFTNTSFDFGAIKEEGGIASTAFVFTNMGDAPLIINKVTASCNCTAPEWPKDPIPPGKSGEIKVGYNPKSRPGPFRKSISVYSNSAQAITVLSISGDVTPKPLTIEEQYPRPLGNLRFKSNFLSLGDLPNTQSKTGELEFINNSPDPIKAQIYRAPAYITARFEPAEIPAGAKGKLIITYDASKNSNYGEVNDRVSLSLDGKSESSYFATVSVTLVEDFSALTPEQKSKAPVASFDNNVFDFGTIKAGQTVSHVFKLTNKGKSDLLIRSVKTTCGCTTTKNANLAKPGETIDFAVNFNSQGKRGRQNRAIKIISNDPNNSTIALKLIGTVEGE